MKSMESVDLNGKPVSTDAPWEEQPLDARILHRPWKLLRTVCGGLYFALSNGDWVYLVYVRPFVVAHAGGRVSGADAAARAKFCDTSGPPGLPGMLGLPCEGRRTIGGHAYCMAEDCRCPRSRWWPPGWLAYRRRLARWACPLGKF